ncbi:C5-sterol desaturase [Melanogaster broomeanus]|nr:C5-sterol desaturase [Melanogaster broomeanus]
MDLILHFVDEYLLDNVWARLVPLNDHFVDTSSQPLSSANFSTISVAPQSAWARDYIPRQLLSLSAITLLGIHLLYFIFAGLSFQFIFNHDMMRHPRFLKDQIKMEIQTSLYAFPGMTLLTLPWFQAEVMGYSRLYDNVDEYGWIYLVLSIPFFLLFTDYAIYWVHRILHHPSIYKTFHKPHHKWIIPTPFASHAFHPVDGYLQSVPYHLFIFIFPLHRWLYLALFVFVNFWSIFIHDSDMITGHPLEHVINGPAHHTLHHLYFTVNYGQYFTWADRVGGSYRQPDSSLDPLLEVKKEKTS